MIDNIIPFGDRIYARLDTNIADESIKTRITDCWATETSGTENINNYLLLRLFCMRTKSPSVLSTNQFMLNHALGNDESK